MIFIVFTIFSVIVCFIWGDWRNWKKYYPTMLYFFIGDSVSDFLLYNKPFWSYCSLIYNHPIMDIALSAVLYPCTALLFLSFYPKSRLKKILYFAMWIAVFTVVEYAAYLIGDFEYFNSWTILHSLVFNMIMFPMIWLHYKKPLLAWVISALLAFGFVWIFHVPLSRQ